VFFVQVVSDTDHSSSTSNTEDELVKEAFNANSGIGHNGVLPILGNGNVLDSSLCATTQGSESRCDGFFPGDAALLEIRFDG